MAGLVSGLYWRPPARIIFVLALSFLVYGIYSLTKRRGVLPGVLFALGLFLAGILSINHHVCPDFPDHHIYSWAHNRLVKVEGFLYRPPEVLPSKTRLYIRTQKVWAQKRIFPATGNLLLTIKDCQKNFLINNRIIISARIRKPRNFKNPGGFDYVRWLAFQDIYCICHVSTDQRVCRMGAAKNTSFLRSIDELRARVRETIDRFASPPANFVLRALILGERKLIPEDIRESFNRSGTAHILAISGLHIGIVAAFAYFLLRRLLSLSERLLLVANVPKLAAFLSLAPILLYSLIAGASVSVQRAFVMVTTYIVALIFNRERDLYHALALAALVILLMQPSALFGASFQLSFVSVLGILFFSPLLLSLVPKRDRLLQQFKSPLRKKLESKMILFMVVSVSAILATAPLVAYHFNRVSLSGLIANLIIVPLVGFIVVPLSLLGVLFTPFFSYGAGCLFQVSAFLCNIVIMVANFFSHLPWTNFLVSTPTPSEVAFFYLFLSALFLWKFSGLPKKLLFLSLFLFTINTFYWQFHFRPQGFQTIFIDVGQGDAALLRFPQGKTMLIDGGGFYDHSFDTGKSIIAPLLLRNRIRRIDYLVMSHPHPDHFDGLRFIAENFSIQEFWTNGDWVSDPNFEHLQKILRQKSIVLHTLDSASPDRVIQGVRTEFLHPPPDYCLTHHDTNVRLNNRSLVIRFSYGNVQYLFAGDIHAAAEKKLLSTGAGVSSLVLKVPHHGSLTSCSIPFVKAVSPRIAVCSAGHQNPFKLPHSQVLQRLRDEGCAVYRTDLDGAIVITADDKGVRVRCGEKLSERRWAKER